MNRSIVFLFLTTLLVSCGGAGDGSNTGASTSGGGGAAVAGARVEETDPAVTLSGTWAPSDANWGWSGSGAMESSTAGAKATVSFSGTSIRWLGSRGRRMGIALVSIDGGPTRTIDLFARPADEAHSPIVTISDLSNGPHTMTIEVTGQKNSEAQGAAVVVDAFDIQPNFTVSHWQDTDPNAHFSAGWIKSAENGSPWSGSGVANAPQLPVTAQETTAAGETLTLPFRGTGISWVGYTGPDGGMANVQIDGGAATSVDTYSPTTKFQQIVFTAGGLADASHTLTITTTGQKNAASNSTRVIVDAFDVITPGRRYEEYDPSVSFVGTWSNRDTRVWSEGHSLVSNQTGATATFHFTGTSVTWIGCEKSSAGGTANVYIDGTLMQQVQLHQSYPIEGYQMPVFRADGLSNGAHTLVVEVTSANSSYVVIDAFDVR